MRWIFHIAVLHELFTLLNRLWSYLKSGLRIGNLLNFIYDILRIRSRPIPEYPLRLFRRITEVMINRSTYWFILKGIIVLSNSILLRLSIFTDYLFFQLFIIIFDVKLICFKICWSDALKFWWLQACSHRETSLSMAKPIRGIWFIVYLRNWLYLWRKCHYFEYINVTRIWIICKGFWGFGAPFTRSPLRIVSWGKELDGWMDS